VQEQVGVKAGELRGQARERMREEVDRRSTEFGGHVDSFAQALRRSAEQLERDDKAAPARVAHQAADRVERLGGYLQGSSADRILGDLERFGRERPWLAGGIGTALGFVAARFLKASSEGRYETSRQARVDADAPLTREREASGELPTVSDYARSS
jgi:ElaB/YqjD/DUF883 family membrane-anchored ribosome-binding protein